MAVVIPVRNSAAYVERALASVFAQTRPPQEIVVVDDGSLDDTAAVVRAHVPRVTLIESEPRGVAAARNTAVEASTAEYVAFLDADDYWFPDHLERVGHAVAATSGRASIYFTDMRIAPERGGGTNWDRSGFAIDGPHEYRGSDKSWLFGDRHPMLIQASVARRDAYLDAGGCDPGLIRRSDTHLIFKLGLRGPLCAVAGIAGEWTADSESSLTASYTPSHPVYDRCTVALYEDLLGPEFDLDRTQRRLLRSRAARARLGLARRCGIRDPAGLASNLAVASIRDPLVPVSAVRRWASRSSSRPG